LDLKLLQLIVDLAEAGSLSKVSAARGIAQSMLSKQVAGLERDFAGKLFYRTGRGVVLTEFGQAIMPRIRALLTENELLKDEIRARVDVPSGQVSLAMQTSVTQSLAGVLFGRIQRDYPKIELRLMEGFSGSIEKWLTNGRTDVGVLSRYGTQHSRLDEALATNDLYLVGARGSPLVIEPTIRFEALGGAPLVLPGAPDGLRLMLSEAARKHGIVLNVAVQADSLTAMREVVASGGGYTILTKQAVAAEIQSRRVQVSKIVDPRLTRTLVLATSSLRPLTSASRIVAALIRELTKTALRDVAPPDEDVLEAPSPARSRAIKARASKKVPAKKIR